jgi:hypothetical protein
VTGSRNKQQCPTAVSRCPGRIEDRNDACFIVKDRSRQALAYVYYEEEPGRRAAANLLTRDEARRIALILPSCRSCFASRVSSNELRLTTTRRSQQLNDAGSA